MAKKASDTFNIHRLLELSNHINLGLVNFNASGRDLMTKYNALGHHKLALLPIEHQVGFFAPLQHGVQVLQKNII
jgi:hypothetical protein